MKDFSHSQLKAIIAGEQHPFWQKANAPLIERLVADFRRWPSPPAPDPESQRSPAGLRAQRVVEYLRYEIDHVINALAQQKNRYVSYSQRYNKAITETERRSLIIEYARELGANPLQLYGDQIAFNRWFGFDAISDRYKRRHLENERYLSFVLQCLAHSAATAMRCDGAVVGHHRLWQRLDLETVLQPLLDYSGDERVTAAAFKALSEPVKAMPEAQQYHCLDAVSLRFIYHAALKNSLSVWIQREALTLLQSSAPEQLYGILEKRLHSPQGADDVFVRRQVVTILGEQAVKHPHFLALLPQASADSSPSVRQMLPQALSAQEPAVIKQYWPTLLLDDPSEQVRASALLGLKPLFLRRDCFELALSLLLESLHREQKKFPLRVGLLVCRQGLESLVSRDSNQRRQQFLNRLLPAIEQLHQQAPFIAVRRWAAQCREFMIYHSNPARSKQLAKLAAFVARIPPGSARRLPKGLQGHNEQELGRALSVLATEDFGFDVEKTPFGYFIGRGHVFGFRLWRFLHEWRHPSPDKRQAFSHTCGRLFWGRLHVPSAILCELAETKVPGEPLFLEGEEGWRGYLPLVDEVLSALKLGTKPTTIYHAEGITTIAPPRSLGRRLWASSQLTLHFAEYARLRNWREQSQESPKAYLNALIKLGIGIHFQGHHCHNGQHSADPAVLRFFPAGVPVLDERLWQQFKDYFISVYENSLYELAVFVAASIAYFIGNHLFAYQQIRIARRQLPLVLGGWGTRGKSGTERIKAALINALGYSIVSKTTGCEAMFLHSHPFGELREMFLFRPYDKATIWEQHNLVRFASEIKTEVFLWECMGLTPSYIDILQRQWMRDDISTITNTYPDHEDLQGPAGINIPQVMTQFIPRHATIITSEEQMRPILKTAAEQRRSRFRAVGWLEAGLLADDVLARFPYDEHPFNIALVMAMGDELGIDPDFALKEMADRVVADIGVLKTYPCAPWQSRRLEFINGMSANERFGCLGNWQRMGFDRLTIEEHIDTWVTCVVNNRADRVARSRVFASILVKDVSFDRCVLIGNNLSGLQSYIGESWAEWLAGVHLFTDATPALDLLLMMAQRFRIPYSQSLVTQRLEKMLAAQQLAQLLPDLLALSDQPERLCAALSEHRVAHAEEISAFYRQDYANLQSYLAFQQQLAKGGDKTALSQAFTTLLWQWFEQKIVVVWDYYATGNQVIEHIGRAAPPGFYNRILGMQNIKGTGLDFVYRWQAWELCYKACQQLLSANPAESAKGLAALVSFQEYGILAEETVQDVVAQVKASAMAQNEQYQTALTQIDSHLKTALAIIAEQNNQDSAGSTWLETVREALEAFLDSGDAVKRRKTANQIYRDLIGERISHERAALELQKLNKRQKGGWLSL